MEEPRRSRRLADKRGGPRSSSCDARVNHGSDTVNFPGYSSMENNSSSNAGIDGASGFNGNSIESQSMQVANTCMDKGFDGPYDPNFESDSAKYFRISSKNYRSPENFDRGPKLREAHNSTEGVSNSGPPYCRMPRNTEFLNQARTYHVWSGAWKTPVQAQTCK